MPGIITIDSPNVKYSDTHIEAQYSYQTTAVSREGSTITVRTSFTSPPVMPSIHGTESAALMAQISFVSLGRAMILCWLCIFSRLIHILVALTTANGFVETQPLSSALASRSLLRRRAGERLHQGIANDRPLHL